MRTTGGSTDGRADACAAQDDSRHAISKAIARNLVSEARSRSSEQCARAYSLSRIFGRCPRIVLTDERNLFWVQPPQRRVSRSTNVRVVGKQHRSNQRKTLANVFAPPRELVQNRVSDLPMPGPMGGTHNRMQLFVRPLVRSTRDDDKGDSPDQPSEKEPRKGADEPTDKANLA
jgi:hypothetical protein